MLELRVLLKITRPQPNTVRQTIQSIFRTECSTATIKPDSGLSGDAKTGGKKRKEEEQGVIISPGRKKCKRMKRETDGNDVFWRERNR